MPSSARSRLLLYSVAVLVTSCGGEDELSPTAPPPPPTPPPEEPNELPTAAFTVDVDLGVAPLTASFDGSSSSDPDGSIVSYSWSFDDGTTASGARVTHTFAEAGMYQVDLTVKDNRDGEATARDSVVVSSPAGSGPNFMRGTVWFDRNMDEAMDPDERMLEGFAVFLDEDEDGVYDNGEAFTFSSADGTYEFAGLDADRSYSVSQILHFGWSSTYAGPSATPSGGPSPPMAAIINGEDADIEVFPFQVALRTADTQRQFCGGTLLNSRYVLTAAHCVFQTPADEIEILIGSADLNSGGGRVKVQAVRSHPEYGATIDYDVAILRLEGSHLYPRVYLQAPDQPGYSTPGDTATAIGWGQTETGQPSDRLKWTTMPIITNDDCGKIAGFMFGRITDRVICAGAERLGRGVCFGDSGGPLIVPYHESWIEIGVASFLVNRDQCGNIPAAFARVTELYDYIVAVARIEESLSYTVDWGTETTARVDFGNFH